MRVRRHAPFNVFLFKKQTFVFVSYLKTYYIPSFLLFSTVAFLFFLVAPVALFSSTFMVPTGPRHRCCPLF